MTNRQLILSAAPLLVRQAACVCAAGLLPGVGSPPARSSGGIEPADRMRQTAPKVAGIFAELHYATRQSSGEARPAFSVLARSNKPDPHVNVLVARGPRKPHQRDPKGTSLGPPLDPFFAKRKIVSHYCVITYRFSVGQNHLIVFADRCPETRGRAVGWVGLSRSRDS